MSMFSAHFIIHSVERGGYWAGLNPDTNEHYWDRWGAIAVRFYDEASAKRVLHWLITEQSDASIEEDE